MTNKAKDKIKASLGTILIHALILLALFFMALKTPLPLPDEEGVEVNLGYSEVGQDIQQEQPKKIQSPPPQPVKQEEKEIVKDIPAEEIVEEETEDAPAIVSKPKPKKEAEKKVEKPKEIPVEKPKEEKKPEPIVDARLLYTGKTASSSEGNDQQKGDKGIASGDLNAPKYVGAGGLGSEGISYNLGNRKAQSLPKPTYNSDDQGRVNVRIRVDKAGRVISAEILQKGTTVSDINLHKMAIRAAKKAAFTPDADAPEIQVGTITYNFIKLN